MRRLRYCVSYFTRTVSESAFRISGNCFARRNREKAALPCSDIIQPFFFCLWPTGHLGGRRCSPFRFHALLLVWKPCPCFLNQSEPPKPSYVSRKTHSLSLYSELWHFAPFVRIFSISFLCSAIPCAYIYIVTSQFGPCVQADIRVFVGSLFL